MSRQVNQRSEILNALLNGAILTQNDASERFGCNRLAAAIFDLKKRGYNIRTIRKKGITRYGDSCEYAAYKMAEEK